MGSLQKLGEIDLELESFGKSDELLGGVRKLAREHTPQGLEAIDVALAELGVAAPTEARPRVETVPPVGGGAKPGTWERPERTEPFPDEGSGLVEVPDEVLRAEPLPAVLELDPEILGAAPPAEPAMAESTTAEQPGTEPTSFEAPHEPAYFDDTTDIRDPQSPETEILGGDDHDTGETPVATASSETEVVGDDASLSMSSDDASLATSSDDASLATSSDDASLATSSDDASLATSSDDASLANLFDDASPPSDAPPSSSSGDAPLASLFDDALAMDDGGAAIDGSGGLADLFEESIRPEAEPGAHEDLSDLLSTELRSAMMDEPGLGSLEGDELDDEPERTAIFTSDEMRALRSSPPPAAEDSSLDAQLDALVSEPIDEASSSDDFELMIDEDMLALEDAELEDAELEVDEAVAAEGGSEQPPGSPSQPPKGFFSRILNRK